MDTGKKDPHTRTRLLRENEELRRRLEEAQQTLEAIRHGDVDALIVAGPAGEQIYTLTGAERTYRVIVETMNEAALTVDPEGTILFCNQRFCDLMKTHMPKVLGRPVTAFAAPPQQAPLNTLLAEAQASSVQRRIALRAADGTVVPVQLAASPLPTTVNHSICLVASDLTELEKSAHSIQVLRQHQEALEAGEERYRRFFMDDLTGDFIATPEGRLVECNPAFAEIYGFESPAAAARYDISEFDPSGWRLLMERLWQYGTIRGHEAWHRRPDGRKIYVVANLVGQFDDAGKLTEIKGYLYDDTPRKVAEEALEAANDRFRAQAEDLAAANEQLLTQKDDLLRRTVELELMKDEAQRTAEEMEWLARISEENPDPVLRVSTAGAVLYRNAAATSLCRRWGTGDELQIPPAIQEMVQAAYADTAAISREEIFGQRTWLLTAAPAPTLDYVNIFARDITERRQAEEALRESEERFRALVTASSETLYRMSPDWSEMRQLHSRGFLANTERPNRNWLEEYIHPDDQPHVTAVIQEAVRTKGVFELEHRVRRADGSLGWTSSRAVPLLDADGEIVEWFGAAADITERKEAENILKIKDNAITSSLNAIAMADLEGRLTYANPAFLKLWGYEEEGEVLGRSAVDFWEEPEQALEVMRAIENGQGWMGELTAVRKDGTCLTLYLSAGTVFNDAGAPLCLIASFVDITTRKQAEEALRRSEERLRLAQQAAHVGTFEWDIRTGVNQWTVELEAMYGLPSGGFAGTQEAWEQLVHPEDRDEAVRRVARAFETGAPAEGEWRVVWPDGSVHWLAGRWQVFKDESGDPVRMTGINIDISDRKRAEEALRESEQRLKLAQKAAHIGVFDWNMVTDESVWTEELCAIFGLAPEDSRRPAEAWQRIVPPEDRARVEREFRAAAAERQPEFATEYRILQPGGAIGWVINRTAITYDEAGRPVRMIGIAVDITTRKRAEEAVRESEERLRLAARAAHFGVYDTDLVSDRLHCSPEMREILGLPLDAPMRLTRGRVPDFVHPDDAERLQQAMDAAYDPAGTGILENEHRIIRPDGAVRWILIKGQVLFDGQDADRRPIRSSGIVLDITERKQAEEALRESRKDLSRAQAVAHTGSWRVDTRRNVLLWSDETYRIFGLPQGTPMTYETFLAAIHPDDRTYVDQRWTACLHGEPYDIEHRIIVGDTVKWVRERAELEFDDAGILLGGFGTVQDITERKQADEALRMSEEKFRTLHAMSPIAIVLNRLDNGQFLESNQALWDMTGYTEEEFRSLTYWDITPAEYQDMEAKQLELLHTVGRYGPYEKEYIRKDGTRFPVLLSGVRIKDPGGTDLIYSVIQDITELKEKENALRGAKEYAESLIETANVMVVGLDEHGGVCVFNEAAEQITGYSREELLGKRWFDVLVPERRYPWVWEEFDHLRAGGLPRTFENPILTKSGAERIISWQNSTMREDGRLTGAIAFGIDITERKHSELALRESEERFHRLFEDDLTGNFLATPAGEILLCNPAFAQIFGFASAEDAIGTNMLDLYPDMREREPLLERLRQQGKIERMEVWRKRRDGEPIYIVENLVGHFNERGELHEIKGYIFDDTERKRAEEALAAKERNYRELVETADSIILRWDSRGTIRFVNKYGARILGYEPGELIGRHLMTLVPNMESTGRDLSTLAQDIVDHPEQYLHNSIENLRKDGTRIWITWTNKAIADEHDNIREVLAIGNDITALKESERQREHLIEQLRQEKQALAESEERYRIMGESVDYGVWATDAAGKATYISPSFCEMVGRSSEEVLTLGWLDTLVPEQRKEVFDLWMHSVRTGEPFEHEHHFISKDGRSRIVLARGRPIRDRRGDIVSWAGINIDITERKQAEEALRESEQRHRRLLDNLKGSHFVYVHDTEGVFKYLSESLTDVLGYTPDEFMAHYSKYMTDHPANQAVHRHTELSIQGVRQPPYEVNVWHKDGSTRWLEVQEAPVPDAAGRIVAVEGVAQDITERKQAEEALRELNATLEGKVAQRTAELQDRARQLQRLTLELTQAEDRERRRLAEILHDDLQQQLAGAKFHLSLMANRTRDDAILHRTVMRVDEMLTGAIEKSRSLSHELSPALLYRSDLADTLRWLAEQMYVKHGLIVRVAADGPVDSSSDALKTFLFRTAQEMLFNIVKHARVQEARLRIRRMAGCLCLSVSDRGRGFDPQEVRATAGFGLLSIRERAQLLGGRMKIKSTPGKGSTFFLAVPDSGTPEDIEAGTRVGPAEDKHRGVPLRVLIVDDHRIVRQSLAALLGDEADLEIVGEAANGREAVNEAHRLRPDVIVMDVSMPLMGGDEATRQIKAALPETRVVALSMFHEPKAARRMHEAGAESYILKTDPSDELLAAVRGAQAPLPEDDDTSADTSEKENP